MWSLYAKQDLWDVVEEDEISFRPKNSVIYDTGIKSGQSVQTSPEHGCWTWAG